MSGLLGGFDGAMQGLTADDLERLDTPPEPAVADAAEPDAGDPEHAEPDHVADPTPDATPVIEHARRAIDPRAQAVADQLLGKGPGAAAAVAPNVPRARLDAAVGTASVECPPAGRVVIGRADGDLQVPLGVVSRRHCAVTHTAAGFTIVDLGSANGTVVTRPGGVIVPVGSDPVELLPGDVIATARGRRPIAHLAVREGQDGCGSGV